MTETRHVIKSGSGDWVAVPETSSGLPATPDTEPGFERQRDAYAHARDILRGQGGGTVVRHTPAGDVLDTNAVFADSSFVDAAALARI